MVARFLARAGGGLTAAMAAPVLERRRLAMRGATPRRSARRPAPSTSRICTSLGAAEAVSLVRFDPGAPGVGAPLATHYCLRHRGGEGVVSTQRARGTTHVRQGADCGNLATRCGRPGIRRQSAYKPERDSSETFRAVASAAAWAWAIAASATARVDSFAIIAPNLRDVRRAADTGPPPFDASVGVMESCRRRCSDQARRRTGTYRGRSCRRGSARGTA
jgi:hypothetical protein